MRFSDTFGKIIRFRDTFGVKSGNFWERIIMRSKNYKGKCVKQSLPKFSSICRTYDDLQNAYAVKLSENDEVMEVQCNILLEETFEGEFTSDFVIRMQDGTVAVRECVFQSNLLRPRMIKLLDLSQRYWLQHGVTDWKVVTNNAEE